MRTHAGVVRRARFGRWLELFVDDVVLAAFERDVAFERHEPSRLDANSVRALREPYRTRVGTDVFLIDVQIGVFAPDVEREQDALIGNRLLIDRRIERNVAGG